MSVSVSFTCSRPKEHRTETEENIFQARHKMKSTRYTKISRTHTPVIKHSLKKKKKIHQYLRHLHLYFSPLAKKKEKEEKREGEREEER